MSRSARRRERPLLGNHQNSWLWGTVPVYETLLTDRWPVYELLLSEKAGQQVHEDCAVLAEQRKIPVRYESPDRLEQLCKARDHQGIAALLGPFPYRPLADLLELVQPGSVFLLLDRLQDPHNVGAIIRSAAAFGCQGLILGQQAQVGITSHVTRSSAGAVNHLTVTQQTSLSETVKTFQAAGARVLAATMQGTVCITKVRQTPGWSDAPLLLIIGNEAEGVSETLQQLCDATVSIPMHGAVESLNAAVAAGILLFLTCQPGQNKPA